MGADTIKDEIVTLVREVLPGEIDSVGDMLMQFEGREENLRDALFMMKERQVEEEEVSIFSMEEGSVSLESPRSSRDLLGGQSVDGSLELPPPPFGPPPRKAVYHTLVTSDTADTSGSEDEESQSPKVRQVQQLSPPPLVVCTPNSVFKPVLHDIESPRVRKKTGRMTYQLSCRKCNKHLLVATTDEDLKTTMGAHFDDVIRLVKSKGKKKEVVREASSLSLRSRSQSPSRQEDVDKFAKHFAKHFKSRFRKKIPSNAEILKFCQENAKIEVMNTEASMRRLSVDKTAMSMRKLCLDCSITSSTCRSSSVASTMDSLI